MKKDWNGLVKIEEIQHLSANGEILWSDKNLFNVFHQTGEQYVLNAAFVGGPTANSFIPANFYFGLDNRSVLTYTDTMDTVASVGNEPNSNGYSRISISSSNVFVVALNGLHYQASGPIISFSALGGSWGPVSNLFLTTKINNTGLLIASVALTQTITLSINETVNMRLGLSLATC